MSDESTQGKRKSLELSALPRLVVPSTGNHDAASSTSRLSHQPHALSVDFQYVGGNGEGVSPCSEISPSSRCSVVSLSPSLFPLPPCGATPVTTPSTTPPTTSYSTTPCLESPPRTSRSQKSVSQWFSPPSPPPSTPLPPTPTQRRLASLIAATNGLENLQVPVSAKVKSPLSGTPDADPDYPLDSPMTPPRRRSTFTVDNQGFRESVVDPDAPLSPPPSSLPPPYSPGVCTPERLSNASVPNSRIDSTTPLVFHPIDLNDGTPGSPYTPLTERERRMKDGDVEAGRFSGFARWHWKKEPKRRKRKMVIAAIGAATAALVMALAGVAVGVYLAISGSAAL
ncbi:hypothetical protein M434DRAFT_18053 [Hypoxylon sp. CO27-5]|nr:hypothetical protein M434DRAFT_18053 [Hypoxylon sp. CO27-5]